MIFKHATYPVYFYIYKGLSDKKFKTKLNKETKNKLPEKFVESMTEFKGAWAHVGNSGSYIVIRFASRKPSIGVIVHEASHAMFRVMEYINNDYTEQGEEAYSYLLQEIVNNINDTK